MKQSLTASISQEGTCYVAQCMQVDVVSQGATEDEALENLRDAIELHFTPPVATITPPVRDIELDLRINRESKEATARRLAGRKARTLKAFQATFENRSRKAS